MCTKLGYMAKDQYGQTYHNLQHPRKDLLERLGRKHAAKMYIENSKHEVKHVGYVIAGLWLNVYTVSEFK